MNDLTPNGLADLARSIAAVHLDKALRARDRISALIDGGALRFDPRVLVLRIVFRVHMNRARRRLVEAATASNLSEDWWQLASKGTLAGRREWALQ